MLKITKTMAAVLALGSSALYAGTMGPVCTPGNVTVPCEASAWDFGIYALYLQERYDYNFAFISQLDTPTTRQWFDYNQDWGWGFKLEGSYHFSTGNDINVNWYHWDHDMNQSAPGDDLGNVPTYTEHNRFSTDYDAVNFEFGQHVDFGEYKDIRFHAGAQFARLEHDSRTTYTDSPGINDNVDHEFKGAGPRAGLDMSYAIGYGFRIYGNSAAAILLGDSDFNKNIGLSKAETASYLAVVPELELKLGGKYSTPLLQGNLSIDAGYMWVNYFNILFNPNNRESNLRHGETDFALHGPYVGLNWVGSI